MRRDAQPLHRGAIESKEQLILETLQNATPEELNYIVTNVDLALMFYKVKDRDVMLPSRTGRRTKIIEILTIERLRELGASSSLCV